MIFDDLKNWNIYFSGDLMSQIRNEISDALIRKDVFEKTIIHGKLIIKTMKYSLKDETDSGLVIESHKNWIDIQFSNEGTERIDVFSLEGLIATTYNYKDDVYIYQPSKQKSVTLFNSPGKFAMLFPWDAHRPMMKQQPEDTSVFKGVVKLDYKLFISKIVDLEGGQ